MVVRSESLACGRSAQVPLALRRSGTHLVGGHDSKTLRGKRALVLDVPAYYEIFFVPRYGAFPVRNFLGGVFFIGGLRRINVTQTGVGIRQNIKCQGVYRISRSERCCKFDGLLKMAAGTLKFV